MDIAQLNRGIRTLLIAVAWKKIEEKSEKLCKALQAPCIIEEMIDEQFSLLANYASGSLMLIDKTNDNYTIKSIASLSDDNYEESLANLWSTYISHSTTV